LGANAAPGKLAWSKAFPPHVDEFASQNRPDHPSCNAERPSRSATRTSRHFFDSAPLDRLTWSPQMVLSQLKEALIQKNIKKIVPGWTYSVQGMD
jgi:hypothetical protein